MKRLSIAIFVVLLVAAIIMPSVAIAGPAAAPLRSTATSTPNLPIPDNNPAGVSDNLNFGPSEIIADVNIGLAIDHTWVGDLTITVTHGATSVTIIDRPGHPATGTGCSGDDIVADISDEAAAPAETSCLSSSGLTGGSYSPNNPLSAFDGADAQGTWTLTVSDNAGADTGILLFWSVIVTPMVPLNYGASCNGNNLDINISAGNGPFNITATTGNGLPLSGVGTGTTTLTGPDYWQGVTITETTGDLESGTPFTIACGTATPGLVVAVPDNTSGEDSSTATVEVSLSAPLLTSVTVPYASSDTTEGTVSGSPLVIQPENWDVPQTITVTGVNDDLDDGDIAYTLDLGPTTSGNPSFAGLTGSANLTNTDDDTAGIGLAAINPFEVDEEGPTSTNFFVFLNTQPTAAVSIAVTNTDGQCSVSPAVLNYTTTNWGTFQEVIVTAVDDAAAEGTHNCMVGLLTDSTDLTYDNLGENLGFTVYDNDTPEIILTPAAFFTWEEGEPVSTYTIELGASPAVGETVTVDIEIVALQLVSQAPIQVTFDESNWNVAVEIDVQPLDDGIDENFTIETITHTATSDLLGSAWEGVTADLTLTIFDTQALAFPPPFHTPNIGEILISAGAPVMSYGAAGDYPTGIVLPADYDGNGFDTYIVTETKTVAGELWFAVFIGNETWVWVPADGVTVLR